MCVYVYVCVCIHAYMCACEQPIHLLTPILLQCFLLCTILNICTFTLNALYTPCVCMCICAKIIIMKLIFVKTLYLVHRSV